MNDLQKKLDELVALRDTLFKLTNKFNLAEAEAIHVAFAFYTKKIKTIVKKHQKQIIENNTMFINATKESKRLTKKSKQLIEESKRLIKESNRLDRENKQLTKETVTTIRYNNNVAIKQSTGSIKILIDNINADIENTTTELTKLITLDKIRNLCMSKVDQLLLLETYLSHTTLTTQLSDVSMELVLSIIRSRSDWHYPGLQVNLLSKSWIDCMLAANPLYITCHQDHHCGNQLLLPVDGINHIINEYSTEYRRHLRIYNIQNRDFSALPQEQFGCIVCYDFLNIYDITIINHYLTTFFKLLRDGGSLICNLHFLHVSTVNKIISYDYFNYAIKILIEQLFVNAGYNSIIISELVQTKIVQGCASFLIEAHKPGKLTTIKAHQVLGSIIEK